MLAESAGAAEGYFYALRGGRAELVCASPEQPAPDSLFAAVDTCLHEELARVDDDVPASGDRTGSHGAYVLLPLAATSLGQRLVAGIVALRALNDQHAAPESALREAIASALIEHDDVDASTCLV
jgi:hypothetical protein